MAYDPPPARSKRRANRQLVASAHGADEQQVHHVRARDQQDEAHCAEEHPQGRSGRRDGSLVKRHEVVSGFAIGLGIDFPDTGRDRVHLRLSGLQALARVEAAHHGEVPGRSFRRVVPVEVRVELRHVPQRLHPERRSRGKVEAPGHDALDLHRFVVEKDRSTDDARITSEAA